MLSEVFFFLFFFFLFWNWNLDLDESVRSGVQSDRLKWKQWADNMRNAGLRGRRRTVEREKQKYELGGERWLANGEKEVIKRKRGRVTPW